MSWIGKFFPIIICFGFSFITFSYCWSWIFNKTNSAFKVFPVLNLFLFYILPLILFAIGDLLNNYVFYFFETMCLAFSPFYVLFKGLFINFLIF